MADETPPTEPHHHSLHERIEAARAAAEEVVAEESGQLGGAVNALAVPFEEIAAAVKAAVHPDRLAEHEEVNGEPVDPDWPREEPDPPHPAG